MSSDILTYTSRIYPDSPIHRTKSLLSIMRFLPEQDSPTPSDKGLRWITLANVFIGIIMLIPAGALSQELYPALGLAFLGPSAFLALYILYVQRKYPRVTLPPGFVVCLDFVFALGLLGSLIAGWVLLAQGGSRWWRNSSTGVTMLGTYGTVPMMISLCVHLNHLSCPLANPS